MSKLTSAERIEKARKAAEIKKSKARAKRNERIVRLYRSGKYSIRSLADVVNLSKTRVHEIVTRYTTA